MKPVRHMQIVSFCAAANLKIWPCYMAILLYSVQLTLLGPGKVPVGPLSLLQLVVGLQLLCTLA